MTHILAIETSTDACSVGLYLSPDNVQECFSVCPAQHTQKILPQINEVLDSAGLSLSTLDAIAFGQGPGSFTGLRIAVSVAQALGFALQKPLLPLSTLRTIAQGAFTEYGHKRVVVIQDARLNEVYWGLYQVNDAGIMVAMQADQLGARASITLPSPEWTMVEGQYPHAKHMAYLGAYAYQAGEGVAAVDAVPIYIRDKVV